jgi:hypothetical protein
MSGMFLNDACAHHGPPLPPKQAGQAGGLLGKGRLKSDPRASVFPAAAFVCGALEQGATINLPQFDVPI